jgi:hypothetical protein
MWKGEVGCVVPAVGELAGGGERWLSCRAERLRHETKNKQRNRVVLAQKRRDYHTNSDDLSVPGGLPLTIDLSVFRLWKEEGKQRYCKRNGAP